MNAITQVLLLPIRTVGVCAQVIEQIQAALAAAREARHDHDSPLQTMPLAASARERKH
ncbi:MAG: hypothetical protein IPG63_04300 [Xanthomonadales bacterium]|nr:hypothetical protein [Xanthomonadales bacterium]MCC6561568.1 hypothetical protein [Xanthomonadales bacterium]